MKIAWGTFTCPDGSIHRQLEISEQGDRQLFDAVASALELAFRSDWVGTELRATSGLPYYRRSKACA